MCTAAGCVPICSNLRMSSTRISEVAAIKGHRPAIFDRRTYRNPVPCGAITHLCRVAP